MEAVKEFLLDAYEALIPEVNKFVEDQDHISDYFIAHRDFEWLTDPELEVVERFGPQLISNDTRYLTRVYRTTAGFRVEFAGTRLGGVLGALYEGGKDAFDQYLADSYLPPNGRKLLSVSSVIHGGIDEETGRPEDDVLELVTFIIDLELSGTTSPSRSSMR
jgi:hypothetical protein